jgi:hypothetical protein
MENKLLYQKIIKIFNKHGYQKAVDEVNELYSKDEITLIQKSDLVSNLSSFQMLTKKQRKFLEKDQENA